MGIVLVSGLRYIRSRNSVSSWMIRRIEQSNANMRTPGIGTQAVPRGVRQQITHSLRQRTLLRTRPPEHPVHPPLHAVPRSHDAVDTIRHHIL